MKIASIIEKVWKDVVHCVRMARDLPHMKEFYWGMAGGKASVLAELGDPEKFRRIEQLSANWNDTDAIDKFLEENEEV